MRAFKKVLSVPFEIPKLIKHVNCLSFKIGRSLKPRNGNLRFQSYVTKAQTKKTTSDIRNQVAILTDEEFEPFISYLNLGKTDDINSISLADVKYFANDINRLWSSVRCLMEDGHDSMVLDMNAIPLGEKLAVLILRLSDRLDIEMERLHVDFDAEDRQAVFQVFENAIGELSLAIAHLSSIEEFSLSFISENGITALVKHANGLDIRLKGGSLLCFTHMSQHESCAPLLIKAGIFVSLGNILNGSDASFHRSLAVECMTNLGGYCYGDHVFDQIIDSNIINGLCKTLPSVEEPNPDQDLACDFMYCVSSLMQKSTAIQNAFRLADGLQQVIATTDPKAYKVNEAALWCIANSVFGENVDSQYEVMHTNGFDTILRFAKSKRYSVSRNALLALKLVVKDNAKCCEAALELKADKVILNILNRNIEIKDEEDLKIYAVDALVDCMKYAPDYQKAHAATKLRQCVLDAVQNNNQQLAESIMIALKEFPETNEYAI